MSIVSRSAVSNHEFKAALRYALHARQNVGDQVKLGVAVSGGVDSMALAYLLRRHVGESTSKEHDFSAFVVDHKARPGSTEEAHKVAANLKKVIGKQPRILTLKWPQNIDPLKLTDFETRARRMRYRALGRNCKSLGITHLLLGHHADDLAETVLTRLSNGHVRGLQGMASSAPIPECEGLYSVYESGKVASKRLGHNAPHHIEDGGVSVVRPLLNFPKLRLRATCKEASIPWVEDKTNEDPTFTQRNAVRALLTSSKLPVALRTKSLLHLSSEFRHSALQESQYLQRLFDACEVKRLDLRSGLLQIELPAFSSAQADWLDLDSQHRIAMSFVRKVFDAVSPRSSIALKHLAVLPGLFFPEKFTFPTQRQHRYTFGGVLIGRPVFWARREYKNASISELNENEERRQFILCRQPYDSKIKRPMALFQGSMASSELPCDAESRARFMEPYSEPDIQQLGFSLWDGRFWVHVSHDLPYPLLVVPLEASARDRLLRKGVKSKILKARFEESLKQSTVETARFTIPAIVAPPGIPELSRGTVLAVPTLGFIRPGWETRLRWDIRYKKISFTNLSSSDSRQPYLWRSNRKQDQTSIAPVATKIPSERYRQISLG